MDQTSADIQKPEVTELQVYSSTATDPKVVRYENLNQRILDWLFYG